MFKKEKIAIISGKKLMAEGWTHTIFHAGNKFFFSGKYFSSEALINGPFIPDVILVDAPLRHEDTFQAIRKIKAEFSMAKVILLVSSYSEQLEQQVKELQVDVLSDKNITGDELISLIKNVNQQRIATS